MNKTKLYDFHTHSTFSDGSDTPEELVLNAKKAGVEALALTDHHNGNGIPRFNAACEKYDMFGIPFGMEIAIELPDNILLKGENKSPDMVVLGKRVNTKPMNEYQEFYMNYIRNKSLPEIVKGLETIFTMPDFDIKEECRSFNVPPKILHNFIYHKDNMQRLINFVQNEEPDVTSEEIKSKPVGYINKFLYAVDRPGHSNRIANFTLSDALSLVSDMNCKLFIAHPGGGWDCPSPKVLDYYANNGVHGIESRNYWNSPEQNVYFDKLAKKHDLIKSGGSDYHGSQGLAKLGMEDKPQNIIYKEIFKRLWNSLPD